MKTAAFVATATVIRVPIERRAPPTLERMRKLAPEPHDLWAVAAAFNLPDPMAVARTRLDTASFKHLPHGPSDPITTLDAGNTRLDAAVAVAVDACWAARDMAAAAGEAQRDWVAARKTGQGWLDRLRTRADALRRRAAELLFEAHACVEVAEGVARRIDLAACDKPGYPPGVARQPVSVLTGPPGQSGFNATVRASVTRTQLSKKIRGSGGSAIGAAVRPC